ncbi:hypothetical protein, partial [Ruminococcus bicirculans (ex Wegman et al. 2014)]|uniref:hypothetical protein n=1 Tax=Ruminococcus bicirculans (ex Wegman et al. 2014) TaxID=1160721 RepID=UPI0022E521C5
SLHNSCSNKMCQVILTKPVGLFDGSQHGIYMGDGEVVYSSEAIGYVTKDLVSNGSWTSWCTYEGVDYPQEVRDKIDENGGDSE